MDMIRFAEVNAVFAENQPEYRSLPANVAADPEITVTCCWKLTWRERFVVLFSGKIWHRIMTFSSPLQPQLLSVEKPVLFK